MRKKPFLQYLNDENNSTLSTIDILRRLNQAGNSLADAEYESTHGPRTIKQKLLLGLRRLGRSIWREVGYIGIFAQKALLLVAFNAVGVCVFFWMLSLL